MADQKITQLTELSVQPASTDVVPIVDISDTTMAGSGTTKKVSVTNLLASKADAVHTHSLNDLSNVDTTGEANGKIIKHNGTSWAVADDADTAALTPEEVQDIVGAMFTGNTETRVAATYEDSDGTIDLVVDDMTADTQLTDEQVQDIIGAMVSGNTETNIAVTYDDTNGKLNFVSTDTNTQLSAEEVQDIIGAMVSGNTETNIAVTYDDTNGKLDFVSTDTNTQLTTEEVQDIVGAMFTGNTETRIAATYEDGDGTIDLVVDDMTANTDTTYSTSVVDSSDDAIIRLTASSGATDDVKLVAGTGITLTPSGDNITIDGASGSDTTYGVSCVDGDNSDEEKIRLTASSGGTDDVVLEAGTGLSVARDGDKITFTNTVSDTNTQLTDEQVQDIIGAMVSGNTETNIAVTYDDTGGKLNFVSTDTNTNQLTTFTVSATTDTTPTTISQGDDLFFAAGTGITCETTANGTVTIAATGSGTVTSVSGTGTVNGLTLTGTVTGSGSLTLGGTLPVEIGVACSDETTALTVADNKVRFMIPEAMTLTEVKASLVGAESDPSGMDIDVRYHATDPTNAGATVFSGGDLNIAQNTYYGTKSSLAVTSLAENGFIMVDVNGPVGSPDSTGLKIWLIGTK